MKSKRAKYESSSGESEETDNSAESVDSSSESEASLNFSDNVHKRSKKKRKRAPSSDSDSDSDDHARRAKKRKHKKKKKKHGKKRRRQEDSAEDSVSAVDASSVSDGEILPKKKHKHKHKHSHKYKKGRSASVSDQLERSDERHRTKLQSVVKERRFSSLELASSPGSSQSHNSAQFYQKEYRRSPSVERFEERRQEVERFYRGSSKDRNSKGERPRDEPRFTREQPQRYENRIPQDRYERGPDKYGGHEYNAAHEEYQRPRRHYEDYSNRPVRYEQRGAPEYGYAGRGRGRDFGNGHYSDRNKERADYNPRYNPSNQHDDRAEPRHRDQNVIREDRRFQQGTARFRDYSDKRERDSFRVEPSQPSSSGNSTGISNECGVRVLQLERYFAMCTIRRNTSRLV